MICKYTYKGQPMGIRAEEILLILPSAENPNLACVVYGDDQSIVVDEDSQWACRVWWEALQEGEGFE